MNHSQWQKLDPDQLPETPAIYAILWRRKWLHLSGADNLKLALEARPWPYRIGLSLSDSELLWMATDDPRRLEAKLKRMLRCQWQCTTDGQVSPSADDDRSGPGYLSCDWPAVKRLNRAIPMVARPLANADPLIA
jgi:hypothetical protein